MLGGFGSGFCKVVAYAMQQQATLVSDMTGPQAKEQPDGVELCLELHSASMFPKSICRDRSSREEGDSCVQHCKHLAAALLWLSLSPILSCQSVSQTSRPRGQEERPAPKIVGHCPWAAGPRPDMGSVLRRSSSRRNVPTQVPLSLCPTGCQSGVSACAQVMATCGGRGARPLIVVVHAMATGST